MARRIENVRRKLYKYMRKASQALVVCFREFCENHVPIICDFRRFLHSRERTAADGRWELRDVAVSIAFDKRFDANDFKCFNNDVILTEEYDELGRLQRTCDGEVAVNKCEGFCSSQVQPSVITPTGFLKECYCCRESYLKDRLVTLSHCYDPDGVRLTSSDMASMDLRLKEPAECKCFKCGDFSR